MTKQTDTSSPAELVAIARAANAIGDKELERAAKRELKTKFGIGITFERRVPAKEAAPC